MRARVSKWGNSLAIRLPKVVAVGLEVHQGEAVELTIEGDTVVMRACRPRFTIEQLVADMRLEAEEEVLDDVRAPVVGRELL